MTRLTGCLPLLPRIALLAVALWLARRLRSRQPEPPTDDDGWALGV